MPQYPLREQAALQVEPSIAVAGDAWDANGESKRLPDSFL